MLVGTIAVETSEYLSELLTRQGVTHNVLNAKEHAREAEIIKDAGRVGAVTIATNMAGRGVDIKIDDRVRELGGLYVLGTERHEARRIDNQLRGRSGRQGDPGETRFYLSGRDDLVRLFAGDRIHNIMERFKLPDDQPMEAGILSRQIENAQKKVEEQNFVARKNVLKYDDVMNVQRQVIYEQRNSVLHGQDLSAEIREEWLPDVLSNVVGEYTSDELSEEWDLDGLVAAMENVYGTGVTADELKGLDREGIVQEFTDDAVDAYAEREKDLDQIQEGLMRDLERFIVLQTVDIRWREHLEGMDYMREGIHLRGMAQKDPLVEYRNEGHAMFLELNDAIREEVVTLLFHAEVSADDAAANELQPQQNGSPNGSMSYEHTLPGRRRRDPRRRHVDRGRRLRGRRLVVDARRAEAEGQLRAREHRPERSLLVRLGQEVQEVPRRLKAAPRLLKPAPPLADDLIRLEPLEQRHALPLLAAVEGDDDIVRFTRVPADPDEAFVRSWIRRYENGWGDGHERRVRPGRPRRRAARFRLARSPGSAGSRSRDRVSRRPPRPWPRGGDTRRRAADAVVVRRARAGSARAPDQPGQHRVGAGRRTGRVRARRSSALEARPGRPPRRLRRVVASRRGVGLSP